MERDKWEQAEIMMLKRRREAAQERIAELALFGQIVEVPVIHDDFDDNPPLMEVPD